MVFFKTRPCLMLDELSLHNHVFDIQLSDTKLLRLKYVSKICGLNFEIVAITRPCIRFLSFS